MIYLIGVRHLVQWKKRGFPFSRQRQADWIKYSSLVGMHLAEILPSAIAEEMNEEILADYGAESLLPSIARDYIARTGRALDHVFAEPTQAEKLSIGYKTVEQVKSALKRATSSNLPDLVDWAHTIAHQHPIREQFWLNKIGKHLSSDVLFVCGDIHLITFSMLLSKRGIASRVFESRVGVHDMVAPALRTKFTCSFYATLTSYSRSSITSKRTAVPLSRSGWRD